MTHYDLNIFSNDKAFLHSENVIDGKVVIGNQFCINTKGEVLFRLPSPEMICWAFEHNEVTEVFCEGKYALINSKGEFLTEFIYDSISCDDRIDYCYVRKNGKHGVINIQGKEVIHCIYDNCYNIDDKYAVLELNGKWGMVDYNNNTIIPFNYDDLRECYNGLIPAKFNGKWGLINEQNQVVIDFKYDNLFNTNERSFDVYMAQIFDKWGIIDKNDNILEPFVFDKVLGDNELFALKKDGKYALYSSLNKQFITDFIYEESIINNDCKPIYHNVFGLMDIYGKSAIKLEYNEFFENYFEIASEDIAIVTEGLRYGAIDKNWNVVIPFEYERLGKCSNGLLHATTFDNKEGYIDRNNNVVIPFGKYQRCSNFYCGFAMVYSRKLGRVYINTQDEIIPIGYIEE